MWAASAMLTVNAPRALMFCTVLCVSVRFTTTVSRYCMVPHAAFMTLSLISGKHKMVILYCLMEFETVRFNELKRYLKTISDKTLSTNLKELETDKLIVRTEYPQIPPKVEYALSERGRSLMKVLDQLCVWGEENRLEKDKGRE